MGSWFLGKKTKTNEQNAPATTLRVQTSVQGRVLPLVWGQNRLAGNIIWYGDFRSYAQQQQRSGGKGGSTGGGGKGQSGNISYVYSASVAIAVADGPIESVDRAWNNKAIGTAAGFGFTTFPGSYSQAAWGYLTTAHPSQALPYRGLAYVAQANMSLGASTELPNISFEVTGAISYAVGDEPDADPAEVVIDFLTNENYGVGWPPARLDLDLTAYSDACLASDLLVSPALTEPVDANSFLAALLRGTNATARWSGGKLTVVPYFDSPITGNGVTYTPDVVPLYDITEDDLLPGDEGGAPIKVMRKRRADMINAVRVQYLERENNYDPDVPEAKDEASIAEYGLRPSDVREMHFFTRPEPALLSAHLQLIREQIPLTFEFKLPAKFILPDVEDILTLTLESQVLFRQPVRIIEITEQDDGSLAFVAEEFLGTAGAPRYGQEATAGSSPNYNADPGNVNEPIIFEPTDMLTGGGGLQVWAAVSGVDTTMWGGCNVYASYDGVTYAHVGLVQGPARMGVTTAPLPAFGVNPIGANVDRVNTLEVDLSMSAGELAGGTEQDMMALNTASYVGGEIIAYQDATLTGPGAYDLDVLNRGAFGTEAQMTAGTKPAGTPFARLDQGILRVPYDQNRIGSTIYLKFQSFNIWGGGLQEVSDLTAYTYVLTGSALTAPLAQVPNVRRVFNDGFTEIWWDDITDFRNGIRYRIYKGNDFAGAEQVGDNAHPPFKAFGNGTYWIVGYCQPVPGLYVYSEDAASITISGNMLVKNLIITSDQRAEGWPGTFTNGVGVEGTFPNQSIRLGGGGDILSDPDILTNPDVLSYGGIIASGTYTIATADRVDVGYVADVSLTLTWRGVGAPVGQDILTVPDILAMPDVLGSASTQYIDVKPQMRIAQDDGVYGDWFDYVPGVFRCRYIDLRLVLSTTDPNSYAINQIFTYQASVPARIDHYPDFLVGVGGVTVTFEPDDTSTPAPFNGGPPVAGSGNQPLPLLSFDVVNAAGVTPVITAFDLASVTFHFVDGNGDPIQVDDCSLIAVGY